MIRSNKAHSFSFTTFPDAVHFQLSFLLVALAAAFLVAPTLFPEINRKALEDAAVARIGQFELLDEIHPGQFHAQPHSGDTKPDDVATFYAVQSLALSGNIGTIKNKDKLKAHVLSINNKDNLEQIFGATAILKALGATVDASNVYNSVIALAEPSAGFRLEASKPASLAATYYAFRTIEVLGKSADFKNTDSFKAALEWVASLQDVHGGFADNVADNTTSLFSTFMATTLIHNYATNATILNKALGYVQACQAIDGGFQPQPIDSLQEFYSTPSPTASTAQALTIIHFAQPATAEPLLLVSLLDKEAYKYAQALNNFKAAVTSAGITKHPGSNHADLEATCFALNLLRSAPFIKIGVPQYVVPLFSSLAVLFFTFAAFMWFKPQFDATTVSQLRGYFVVLAVLLVAGFASTQVLPKASLPIYLVLGFYVLSIYYEAQRDDSDGMKALVGSINTLLFVGFLFAFLAVSPVIFGQTGTFVLIGAWSFLASFLAGFGATYFVGRRKFGFYVDGALLAYSINVIALFLFLYARGDFDVVLRLINIRGQAVSVFVVLPLVLYFFTLAGTTAGAHLNFDAKKSS